MNGNLTAIQRFFLAFVAFFWVLFDVRFAQGVRQLRERQRGLPPAGPAPAPEVGVKPAPATEVASAPPSDVGVMPPSPEPPKVGVVPPPKPPEVAPTPPPVAPRAEAIPPPVPSKAAPAGPSPEIVALHVLGTLQRDGRLVDFLSEDLTGFNDSEIGAAARTVHAGCRKTLETYLAIEPIYREPEGASVTVAAGFDPSAIRITGNVIGNPPFRGSLRHHGWRATRATFPPIPTGHDPHIVAPAEVEL